MEFLLRKLVLTFIVLVSTFVLIVVSTFAWFNNNSTSELGSINFQVTGSSALEFSLDDGNTWVSEFSGDDIYKQMMKYYDSIDKTKLSGLFYNKVANGNIDNTKTVYGYRYQLVTPLATEKGFVTKFYNMEQKVIENEQTLIFNNLTDGINQESEHENYRYYDPTHGYIKFTFKVRCNANVNLYLKDCIVSLSNYPSSRDYFTTSIIRVGFSSDYITNNNCTNTDSSHIHNNSCKHLKVYEPVDDLIGDLDGVANYNQLLQEINSEYISTYGVGYYFNKDYADKFTILFNKYNEASKNLVKEKDATHYELNEDYNNGEYSLTYYKEALEISKLGTLYDPNSTVLLEANNDVKDLTMYIWCEGWDGCSGNFAGLGQFNLSFSFTGLPS